MVHSNLFCKVYKNGTTSEKWRFSGSAGSAVDTALLKRGL